MANRVPDIPSFDEDLLNAAREGRLLLFVGAGASMLVDGPSWDTLGNKAWAYLYSGDYGVDEETFYYWVDDKRDPLDRLSSAAIKAEEKQIRLPYEKWLDTENMRSQDRGSIHEELLRLNLDCLTTNVDRCFDRAKQHIERPPAERISVVSSSVDSLPRRTIKIIRNVDEQHAEFRSILDKNHRKKRESNACRVVHLHGHLDIPTKMVLTTGKYSDRYANALGKEGRQENKSLFIETLTRALSELPVLFIGYGLNEDPILDKVLKRKYPLCKQSYALWPVKDNDVLRLESDITMYMSTWGIELLPYSIGEGNYMQLIEVVKEFGRQVRA